MEAERLAAIVVELEEVVEKHMQTTGRILAHCEYLTKRAEELEAACDRLNDRIGLVQAQTVIRDNALGEQLETLDDRVTTVHRAALRALNLTSKGDPAA